MLAYDPSKMTVLDEDRAFVTSTQVFTLHTFEDDQRYYVENTQTGITNFIHESVPLQFDDYSGTNASPSHYGPVILRVILRSEVLLSRVKHLMTGGLFTS